jgi:hypothetical protein
MTQDEAGDDSRQKPSYLCVILRTAAGAPMGVLFMDSEKENAFGNEGGTQDLDDKILRKCDDAGGLRQGLENIVVELQKYRVGIEIHG